VKGPRRAPRERLDAIGAAIETIARHLERGGLDDPLVFDAVRMRLVEIGEAVSMLPDELLASEPAIPWRAVVSMRHKLAHHYYDTALGILEATVRNDLPELASAVARMKLTAR
jgi:uncharacterized protein with HEPN domain